LTPPRRRATFLVGRYDLPLAPFPGTVNVSQAFQSPFARTTGQQRKHWHSRFVQAKEHGMRDFRDAKAMAHTLRAALAAKGLKITVSQSLELIAEVFGVADWNTLAAAIRREAPDAGKSASPPPRPSAEWAPTHSFSRPLALTLRRALDHAGQRDHEYTTLEHLLLALTDDVDASLR
jgi:Glyoxalase superfamily protein/Clp amino terminal domain, pathogenicity island component